MYKNYQLYRLQQYWNEVLEHFKAQAEQHKCNDIANICNQIEFDIPDEIQDAILKCYMRQMGKLSALELFERRLMSLDTALHCNHHHDDPEEEKCYENR